MQCNIPAADRERYLADPTSFASQDDLYSRLVRANIAMLDHKYADARVLWEQLVTATEEKHGRHALEVANALIGLTQVLYFLYDRSNTIAIADLARSTAERALQIHETGAAASSQPLNMAACLFQLARLSRSVKAWDASEAAKSMLQRALEIQEAVLAPTHPELAYTLCELASVLRPSRCGHWVPRVDLAALAEARPLLQRALDIFDVESHRSPTHRVFLDALFLIGQLAHDQRDLPAAEQFFERALRIIEKWGINHRLATHTLINLAFVAIDMGKIDEARFRFHRAMIIQETAFGPEYHSVDATLNILCRVLNEHGEQTLAKALRQRPHVLARKCPQGHALVLDKCPDDFRCNVCGAAWSKGIERWGSCPCRFGICMNCVNFPPSGLPPVPSADQIALVVARIMEVGTLRFYFFLNHSTITWMVSDSTKDRSS